MFFAAQKSKLKWATKINRPRLVQLYISRAIFTNFDLKKIDLDFIFLALLGFEFRFKKNCFVIRYNSRTVS